MKLSSSKKALLAGVLGTALQWYDFAIFGYFAPIIAATYFPKSSHCAALLSAFGVFAVGYLLAPLGSIVLGYISKIPSFAMIKTFDKELTITR